MQAVTWASSAPQTFQPSASAAVRTRGSSSGRTSRSSSADTRRSGLGYSPRHTAPLTSSGVQPASASASYSRTKAEKRRIWAVISPTASRRTVRSMALSAPAARKGGHNVSAAMGSTFCWRARCHSRAQSSSSVSSSAAGCCCKKARRPSSS